MGLLRITMKLLRPAPDIPEKAGKAYRLRRKVYCGMLAMLRRTYASVAICDRIDISTGGIRIVHERRDFGFEDELRLFGFDTTPRLAETPLPVSLRKKRFSPGSGYFRLNDRLSVYSLDGETIIEHGKQLNIGSTVSGTTMLMASPATADIIFRTEIGIATNGNKTKTAISPLPTPPKPAPAEPVAPENEKIYDGFIEDDSF